MCLEVGRETHLLVLGTHLPNATFTSRWCPLRLRGGVRACSPARLRQVGMIPFRGLAQAL